MEFDQSKVREMVETVIAADSTLKNFEIKKLTFNQCSGGVSEDLQIKHKIKDGRWGTWDILELYLKVNTMYAIGLDVLQRFSDRVKRFTDFELQYFTVENDKVLRFMFHNYETVRFK